MYASPLEILRVETNNVLPCKAKSQYLLRPTLQVHILPFNFARKICCSIHESLAHTMRSECQILIFSMVTMVTVADNQLMEILINIAKTKAMAVSYSGMMSETMLRRADIIIFTRGLIVSALILL